MSIKVAIVGCGSIAHRHIHGYQQVEDAEFVGMCDLIREKAESYAEEFGGRAYADVVEMLESEEPDIVDVCTREQDRDVPVIEAVERGFTTIAEKPIFAKYGAASPPQFDVRPEDVLIARRMVKAADEGGAEFYMAYNYRFNPYAQELKGLIDAGELGDFQYVHAITRLACWSHVIDLIRWFCGEVEELAARMCGPENTRTRAAALRFESGAVGTLLGNGIVPAQHDMFRIEWCGSEEMAVLRDISGGLERYPHNRDQRIIIEQAHHDPRGHFLDTFDAEIKALCDHVRDGTPTPAATGLDGLRELEVDAAYGVAAESREWLNLREYWDGTV